MFLRAGGRTADRVAAGPGNDIDAVALVGNLDGAGNIRADLVALNHVAGGQGTDQAALPRRKCSPGASPTLPEMMLPMISTVPPGKSPPIEVIRPKHLHGSRYCQGAAVPARCRADLVSNDQIGVRDGVDQNADAVAGNYVALRPRGRRWCDLIRYRSEYPGPHCRASPGRCRSPRFRSCRCR